MGGAHAAAMGATQKSAAAGGKATVAAAALTVAAALATRSSLRRAEGGDAAAAQPGAADDEAALLAWNSAVRIPPTIDFDTALPLDWDGTVTNAVFEYHDDTVGAAEEHAEEPDAMHV